MQWQWPLIKINDQNSIIIEPNIGLKYKTETLRNIFNSENYSLIRQALNNILSNLAMSTNVTTNNNYIYWDIKYSYYSDYSIYGVTLGQRLKLNSRKKSTINNYLLCYNWNNKIYLLKSEMINKFYIKLNKKLLIINRLYSSFDKLHLIKNEIDFNFTHKHLGIKCSYTYFNKKYSNLQDLYNQAVIFELKKNLNNLWCIGVIMKKHLGSKIRLKNIKRNKWISHEIALLYKGDCFKFNCGIKKDYLKLHKQLKSSMTTYCSIEPIFH